jgi:hypothetical protein
MGRMLQQELKCSFGATGSWSSKRQSVVATSTTEAEYVAAAHATKEAVWLQMLLRELGEIGSAIDHVKIRMDNTGAIALTKNPEFHQRTKHMDVRWQYIREQVETGKIQVEYTKHPRWWQDTYTRIKQFNLLNAHLGQGGPSSTRRKSPS